MGIAPDLEEFTLEGEDTYFTHAFATWREGTKIIPSIRDFTEAELREIWAEYKVEEKYVRNN